MKVLYVGPDIGATGLMGGCVYEVSEIDWDIGALRVIDEDLTNWNYKNDPNWLPGYLYSPTDPAPLLNPNQKPGKFYIVEDEDGQLARMGVPPMPDYLKK